MSENNISQEDIIIGLWNDYDICTLVTIKELKEYVAISKYSLIDYLDGRKATNLTRFKYCPFSGKKIDWKKMRKDYSKEIES